MTDEDEPSGRGVAGVRAGRRVFAIVFCAAALLRAVFFVSLDNDPRFDGPRMDADTYHKWATAWGVYGRSDYREPEGEPFWRTPGYPAVLSVLYRFIGPGARANMRAMTVVQMAFGAFAIALAAAAAARRWGLGVGLLAGALALLHGPLPYFESLLLPVGLAGPLVTLGVLGVLGLLDPVAPSGPSKRASWRAGASGLALGAAAALRSNWVLAAGLAFAALVWRPAQRRYAVWLALGVAIPLSGVATLSYVHAGTPALAGLNGPMNFFFAYGEYGGPTFDVVDARWGEVGLQASTARLEAARELGVPLAEVDRASASRYFGAKAVTWIRENPAAALVLAGEKLLGVFTWRDLSIVAPMAASRDALPLLRWLVLPFPLLAALAFFGAWSGVRGRGARDEHATTAPGWAVALAILPVLATALLFFTYTRFRLPAVPLFAFAAAFGLRELVRGLRAGERIIPAVFACTTAALVLLTWDPHLRPQARALHYIDSSDSQSWIQRGYAYYDRGTQAKKRDPQDPQEISRAFEAAVLAFQQAVRVSPTNLSALEWVARIDRDERGRFAQGCKRFAQLRAASPIEEHPNATAELALCALRNEPPDPKRAARLFDRLDELHLLSSAYAEDYADALIASGRAQDACKQIQRAALRPYPTRAERKALRRKAAWAGCLAKGSGGAGLPGPEGQKEPEQKSAPES